MFLFLALHFSPTTLAGFILILVLNLSHSPQLLHSTVTWRLQDVMDVASETEAMLQGPAQEATTTEVSADGALTDEAASNVAQTVVQSEQMQSASGEPTVVQQVNDGKEVTTAAETYVVREDDTAQAAMPAEASDINIQAVNDALAASPAAGEPQSGSDQQPEQLAQNGTADTHTSANGLPTSDSTAVASTIAEQPQTEPDRGRSRKRRARWGPPANQVAEPAAELNADGAPTGRKKRRSRWEEPAPAADDSQQLAVVDMSNGSGFPHEIVLAGGIKVNLLVPLSTAFCKSHLRLCCHLCKRLLERLPADQQL